ncbi:MAG: Eco57I restriction-modification methylase domain-containing protein [Deltaproteobacteria bacterium]|jgi:type II restriction enzyme|nr:Eco57I restriction-modification methylase domain-containing protein [Deltaproteobacteria bacterium]
MPRILEILLLDRTASTAKSSQRPEPNAPKNIIWANDNYQQYDPMAYAPTGPIKPELITGQRALLIRPRALKTKALRKERTRTKAEVFTPTWVVKMQNDTAEESYKGDDLERYVGRKWLEITCGEAPYMTTRYDMETGQLVPIAERVGFVDRKLERINKEVTDQSEWQRLVELAYKSCYGFEWNGDSLLLARENLLYTYRDYHYAKWNNQPIYGWFEKIATIISHNLFQMDGLKKTIEMKFDVVVGNPPYQASGKARDEPVYHHFYDLAAQAARKYCLISPARFLFNAGQTPKTWNLKMLSDEHLKVVYYEQNSASVFPNTDIKGGITIIYREVEQVYGSIGVFTHYHELNSIVKKTAKISPENFSTIVQPQGLYRFSERFFAQFPQAEASQGQGTKNKIVSKSFSRMDFAFHPTKKGQDDIRILGLAKGKRDYKWISSKYLVLPESFNKYRVIIAETNNSGLLGETLSSPLIGLPGLAHTDTFLTIGSFDSHDQAQAVLKYIKTKFARALLGVLKITQHNSRSTWAKVPLQDFTPRSDIDWTKPVSEIDKQLYLKYGLDQKEITFIEAKVIPME